LAVVDDPTTKQRVVQQRAGAYAGVKKYGEAANLPASAMKKRGAATRGGSSSPSSGVSVPSPLLSAEALAKADAGEGRGGGSTSRDRSNSPSKIHKPHLDEMHGPESLPYRPTRATPRKPDLSNDSGSKIFQPTDSRQSGPEFGPAPRSTGGAPGHRGGWKKR
jgi:excinuclease ABC subunit B